MSRRPRQLPLPNVEHHAGTICFDVNELEILTASLSDAAARAFLRLSAWSWQYGPLPVPPAARASIARAHNDRQFVGTWRELAPLFVRRRAGYVAPWLEKLRAARDRVSKSNANNGRASGRARRGRPPAPASTTPRLVGRHLRPPATFELLCAYAEKELWDRYDAFDPSQPEKPTIEDMKAGADRLFDRSADQDVIYRAFNAVEAARARRSELHRASFDRRVRR